MCEQCADRRSQIGGWWAPSRSDPSLCTCLYLLFNINQMKGFYFDVSVICFQMKFSGLIWQWHAQYTVHTDSDDTFATKSGTLTLNLSLCKPWRWRVEGAYRALLILNNYTRWRWVFRFTPQLLYSGVKYHARFVLLIWTFWWRMSSLVPIGNENKVSLSPRP